MAIRLSPNCMYNGLDIYKEVNKDIKNKINHYEKQIKHNHMLNGFTVLEMLRDLEDKLKLELSNHG